ncbi:hypothetical protein MLD38_023188 [Melastoma candidum]|uniref:Uncharacterized protein n=1 Tax=Melastoma candidum TaxID=119954 RepID=A0ACB9QNI6_9MYRT|nr:hypothetical protein MLD38_023188 [Melastoma candidum]
MSRRSRFSGLRSQTKKQGPCDHCGIAESPMWRNGPTRKPVLCNACGSRWRLRRSLTNYVPNQTYPLRKRRSRKSDKDFCCYDNVVKIEDGVSLRSDGNQTSVELVAGPNHKSSSEFAIPDQPIIKIEPVFEDENQGADIDKLCIEEVPSDSEDGHLPHIKDLCQYLRELYANRRFASSYEPTDGTLIYNDTPSAPSVGKESTLGVVLLEPPKLPEKKVSEAWPLLVGADISIVEAPKRADAPPKTKDLK